MSADAPPNISYCAEPNSPLPRSGLVQFTLCAAIHNTQNAYIESFNGRLRDECLNEHWFTSLAHARTVIEAWRREYNEERPKRVLGGLTPSQYARQLAEKTVTVTAGL
jgi:putative transposase